jgi:hypothetical protein
MVKVRYAQISSVRLRALQLEAAQAQWLLAQLWPPRAVGQPATERAAVEVHF